MHSKCVALCRGGDLLPTKGTPLSLLSFLSLFSTSWHSWENQFSPGFSSMALKKRGAAPRQRCAQTCSGTRPWTCACTGQWWMHPACCPF